MFDSDWKASNLNENSSPLNVEFLSPANKDSLLSTKSKGSNESTWDERQSPNNLISLSESPKTTGNEGLLWNPFCGTKEQRDDQNRCRSSDLPPASRRRPLSCQINTYQNSEIHHPLPSQNSVRRYSMYSQSRHALHPPLPHQTQAHFFGAPDPNSILPSNNPELVPRESNYYCGFDVLLKENVVLVGYDGGLDIYAISKRGLSKISGIEGLRGGVHNAKIIPWSVNCPNPGPFPLIAIVINGPVDCKNESSDSASQPEDVMPNYNSPIQSSSQYEKNVKNKEYYQTRVEIYTLSPPKSYVSTLLSLPKIQINKDTSKSQFEAPAPTGSLAFRADCGYLVVTSGATGETWIFTQNNFSSSPNQLFKFIAKIWTTIQHGVSVEGASSKVANGWHTTESQIAPKQLNAPIITLNGRWLAYCPSDPSSQTSLSAVVKEPGSSAMTPGIDIQGPQHLPEVNCGVEIPGRESMMMQIAQKGTQNFIRAGNYLAQQGIQAWANYRNKPANSGTVHRSSSTHTKTTPTSFVSKDPGLISILDLDFLKQHNNSSISLPHPSSTFKVPNGCSFLSFSPNGLSLFTASCKGDVQLVWDLMQIRHAKNSILMPELLETGFQGPHVRQIAQFSRMTIARIVDVVWTSPHGERAAMVTEAGTIHILDLPASAFTWPPLCRLALNRETQNINGENITSTVTATGVATSAVNSFWTAARPFVSTRRRSSTCLSARSVTLKAGHGTQALAAGISRSVGAATEKMYEMRKSGGTKLHLPRNSAVPNRPCVLLLNKKRNDFVFAIAGGVIRLYSIKNRRADRPADNQKACVKLLVEYLIPTHSAHDNSLDKVQDFSFDDHETIEAELDEISRGARHSSPLREHVYSIESSISNAEIEPNSPYQPFHTDKRVGLFVHSDRSLLLPPISVSSVPQYESDIGFLGKKFNRPWVFGKPIMTSELDVGPRFKSDIEVEELIKTCNLSPTEIESIMRVSDNAEKNDHIVITTRRRIASHRPGADEAGNEFGFFEDDCEMLDFASQKR